MRFPTPACQLAIDFKHYSASASSWSSEACRALDVGHSTHARDHPLTRDQSQRLATKRRPESARASHPNLTETAPLLRVWQALLAPTQSNPSDRRIKEKRRIRRIACLMARMAADVCHAWIRRPQERVLPMATATKPPLHQKNMALISQRLEISQIESSITWFVGGPHKYTCTHTQTAFSPEGAQLTA